MEQCSLNLNERRETSIHLENLLTIRLMQRFLHVKQLDCTKRDRTQVSTRLSAVPRCCRSTIPYILVGALTAMAIPRANVKTLAPLALGAGE
jgi:hypothetical protein